MKWIALPALFLIQLSDVKAQLPLPSVTDNSLSNRIDTMVQHAVSAFMSDTSRVGLSIGIVRGNNTYTYNYGSVKKDDKVLPTKNTIYEVGSISKTFTALLLAQALGNNKIKLDDDVRVFLGDSYTNLQYQGQPIKVIHLTNHTSGLPPFLPNRPDIFQKVNDSIPFILANIHGTYTKENFLNDLRKVKIDTVPGFKYQYSNTAAQLICFILENIYNTTYEELIDRYVSKPLAMKHTQVSANRMKNGIAGLAAGHDSRGNVMPYMPVIMQPSGGICSSVGDMLNFIQFQLNEKNALVKLSHLPTRKYTDSTGIGLFWRINKASNNIRKIWHTGGTFGFSSYCVLYPEINTGLVFLSNEFDQNSQGELIKIAEKLFEGLNTIVP